MITQVAPGGSGGSSGFMYAPVTQIDYASPEGGSVSIPPTIDDVVVRLTPAAQLSSATVSLPGPASPRIRQIVFIHTTNGITELMVTAPTGVTVDNFVSDLQPGDCVAYFRISSTIWARIK